MRMALVKRATSTRPSFPACVALYGTEMGATTPQFTASDLAREQDLLRHYRLSADRDAARLELAKLHDERHNAWAQAVGTLSPAARDLWVRVTDPGTTLNTHAALVAQDRWTLAEHARWNGTHDGDPLAAARARTFSTETAFGLAATDALQLPLADLTQRFFERHSTSDRGRLAYAHAIESLLAQGYPAERVAQGLDVTPDEVAARLADATHRLDEALANQELFDNVKLATGADG
jgi:hypothetical protein